MNASKHQVYTVNETTVIITTNVPLRMVPSMHYHLQPSCGTLLLSCFRSCGTVCTQWAFRRPSIGWVHDILCHHNYHVPLRMVPSMHYHLQPSCGTQLLSCFRSCGTVCTQWAFRRPSIGWVHGRVPVKLIFCISQLSCSLF